MEIVYQLKIVGQYKNFDNEATFYSKKLLRHFPTQADKDEFAKKCYNSDKSKPISIYDLDENKPYSIKVIELILED